MIKRQMNALRSHNRVNKGQICTETPLPHLGCKRGTATPQPDRNPDHHHSHTHHPADHPTAADTEPTAELITAATATRRAPTTGGRR
jgi:hypothetical protein